MAALTELSFMFFYHQRAKQWSVYDSTTVFTGILQFRHHVPQNLSYVNDKMHLKAHFFMKHLKSCPVPYSCVQILPGQVKCVAKSHWVYTISCSFFKQGHLREARIVVQEMLKRFFFQPTYTNYFVTSGQFSCTTSWKLLLYLAWILVYV